MSGEPAAKRKSNYYSNRNNKNKSRIETNLKGFLVTCNNREKDCVRESYNLLNKYADKLYPVEENASKPEESIEESLEKELAELKNTKAPRRFQSLDSGARNVIFISTTLDDPAGLTEYIVKDIYENKQQQTKFLLRLTPVEVICRADTKIIVESFKPLAEKYFREEAQTFSIVINNRNNDAFKNMKEDVIKLIAEQVSTIRDDHKVDLKAAKISILIDVIKSFAFMAVVHDYFKYKKYNLLLGSNPVEENKEHTEENKEDSN